MSDESKSPQINDLDELRRQGHVIRENAAASVLDLGDRVALIEFHTKANSLNDDVCEMIIAACEQSSSDFDALVIGNRGKHFSAGANLAGLLGAAREARWSETEHMIRNLQRANMAIKYGPLPVVAAPFSNALGGGCEVCLHSAWVVAAEITHMGLVETGVGLIPAGGGTKELAIRALDTAAKDGLNASHALLKPFDLIFRAKVSRSGEEAEAQFLSGKGKVVPGDRSPIGYAKSVAIALAASTGHVNHPCTDVEAVGAQGIRVFESLISEMRSANAISDHDALIARKLAVILCGGESASGLVSEQHFLDLEREAFLSLLGTQKTQERIEHLLKENKPLRN